MKYEDDSWKLDQLISEALRNEEIQSGANQVNIQEEFLKSKIKEKSSEILESATKEIEFFNNLNEERDIEQKKLSKEVPHPILLKYIEKITLLIIGVLIIIVIKYIVSNYFSSSFAGKYFVFSWLDAYLPSIFLVMVIVEIMLYILHITYENKYNRDFDAKRKELGIEEIDERVKLAEQKTDKTILEIGILPELRSIINIQLIPSYDTTLTKLNAPGLAEIFDPVYEIPTESKEKLHSLLKNMPGGSIGIAGPRGVGKTTLLSSFCRGSIKEIEGRQVLSIMTSAPVEYEARDFVLHIFASVCNRVLELNGERKHSPWEFTESSQESPIKTFNYYLNVLTSLRSIIIFILIGSFLIALNPYITDLITMGKTHISSMGFIFILGVFFIVLSFFLVFVRMDGTYNRRRRYQQIKEHDEMYYGFSSHNIILKRAHQWLQMIRFQSSYSSGWSGALKFSFAEGGVSNAVSRSQNQLTLPEIIDGYCDFLKLATQNYVIIIGIDELDKIQSSEKAHRFLNEIKAIFGLENCFYLISVSESAISSFERRGLPFRDVFDSSFDDMIYVNYLSLEAAKNLIRRRVIGMPIPYVCFCYCMSAGLARDLIRTCRNLLELVQLIPEKNNLSMLCGSLIRTDLKHKLRAVSIEAKDIILEPEVTQLFEDIHKIEKTVESPKSLLGCCFDLLCIKQVEAQHQESNEVLANRRKLSSLRDELGTYIYYTVTMLEFFGEDTRETSFKHDEDSGVFKQLATARQFLSTNSSIGRSMITDVRRSHDLDILECK